MKTFLYTLWLSILFAQICQAQESVELAVGKADAIVDLKSTSGTNLLKATWKYQNAQIIEKDFKAPGPDKGDPLALYPTGKPVKTHDISPKAGTVDFNDSAWELIKPEQLDERKTNGLLAFGWYRIQVTIPEKLGNFSTTGSTAVFELVMDDYAEIYVNGKLNKSFGQSGGSVPKGWNARNRIVLSQDVKPGDKFQIAILGINGPIADLPNNYIWVRSATLDFYQKTPKRSEWQNLGEIIPKETALNDIFEPNTKIEKLAEGFQFTEGPIWHPDGFLIFSDPNANVIYAYHPENGNVSVYMTKSGYRGIDIGEYGQPGSNGLTFDQQGRLTACEHGNRRIVRHEIKGPVTVLADKYEGKRFNSPNDLLYRSDGILYWTDPPYGLPKFFEDTRKELSFSGVFALINGQVKLVSQDLKGPNGLAFSPDEKYLYVTNWDITDINHTKVVMRYEVKADGTLGNGKVFFDMNQAEEGEALDGIKIDKAGNLFVSGPGGVWVISAEAKLLGKIKCPELPANFAWGDADGKGLYMTARSGLYKIRVKTGGKTSGIYKP
ncbi:MAG: SMP-30/gluconolactonase/LRE family protein [Microscillaceae bacterium]|nr:SMP-30/gluconolactonase/LRE family protein [Microscillaceae bacterium]